MKKIYFTFVGAFLTALCFGQNIPIDFESTGNGAGWTWTVFENGTTPPPLEIIGNPFPSGINLSPKVAKFTAYQVGAPWAGCESQHGSDIGTFNITPSNHIITIMVYKTKISNVGIKLVTSTNASLGQILVANTVVNQWEMLTFDFSAHIGGMTYDQIVIFPDFIARTADDVIYFDNVWGGDGGGCLNTTSSLTASSCDTYTSPSGNLWNTSGQYVDTIPNAAGCDSIISVNLTVNSIDDGTSLSGGTITANQVATGYQWINCDNNDAPIIGQTSQSYVPTANGNYAAVIYLGNCSDTTECVNITGLGLSTQSLDSQLNVYPNPTDGSIAIDTELQMDRLEVYSMQGQIIFTSQDTDQLSAIDLSRFDSGVYLLKVYSEGNVITKRIAKK